MNKFKKKIDPQENSVKLVLSPDVYSLETVYTATYSFLDKVYIVLDGDPEKEIIVNLKGKQEFNEDQLEVVAGEFLNELINSGLRLSIAKKNRKTKEYIMSAALIGASSEVQERIQKKNKEEDEDEKHNEDPLGIAQTWEDKYDKQD